MTTRRNRKQKQTPPPPLRPTVRSKEVTGPAGKKEKEKKNRVSDRPPSWKFQRSGTICSGTALRTQSPALRTEEVNQMSEEENTSKSLSLRLGAVLAIFGVASALLVYGFITEPTWLEVAKSSIDSLFSGG